MKLKTLVMAALLAIGAMQMTGCGYTMVEPGHTGIKINLSGSDRGVSKENIVTGRCFYNSFSNKIVQYPTFNQRVSWTANANGGQNESRTNEELAFQTKDKIKITFDASLNYMLNPTKVPEFYTQFRCDNIEFFTHGFLRDKARSAVSDVGSQYTFEEVNGAKKAEFESKINEALAAIVAPYGVEIGKNGFSIIGNIRPPENIAAQINENVIATQKAITAENELRAVTAEAAKAVEKAKGEAKANELISRSLTPTLMEARRLDVELAKARKWNGALPSTVLGGGPTLFNLK